MSDWQQYELLKAQWMREHPEATPEEIEQAMQAIARRLGL